MNVVDNLGLTACSRVFEAPAGRFTGYAISGAVRASGIRYARAVRFGLPNPEPESSGEIFATALSPACPQASMPVLDTLLNDPLSELQFDEDCLRLSVTVPEGAHVAEKLPVMVFIHGGGYAIGAGDASIHDPIRLVTEQRIVAVNVNHRLGIFGFIGDGKARPANLGLLDLIESLRWVSRNIAAFGGDPENVTVYGQSAGGDAAAHLMISEGTSGLFRRAIIQSPPLGLSRGRAEMNAALAAELLELDEETPVEEVLASEGPLRALAGSFGPKLAAMPFGTQYGFAPLPPESEVDGAWERVARDFEVLIGSASREGALFVDEVPAVARILHLPLVGGVLTRVFIRWIQAAFYDRGITHFVRRHRRGGGAVSRYKISWGAPGNRYRGAHCVDLPLLFGDEAAWNGTGLTAGANWDELDAQGRQVRSIWAGFARDGRVYECDVPGLIRVENA